jgi:hypothetical protein
MRNRHTGSTAGIALALIAAGGTGIGCAPAAAPVGPAGSWGPTAIVEELAIGVDVGAPEYMFGAVRDIAVAPDGRIFAYQLSPRLIREYDGDGNHARDLGREGQGPGEYQSPAIEVMPDGRLVAWDVFNNRLSFYERDGSYAHGLQIDASLGGSAALRLDTEGYVYIRAYSEIQIALTGGPASSERAEERKVAPRLPLMYRNRRGVLSRHTISMQKRGRGPAMASVTWRIPN